MNERVKKLWIEALRSGEYKQTTGTLKGLTENNTTGFCCLGVLTDLAVKEDIVTWGQRWLYDEDDVDKGVWFEHPDYPKGDNEVFESLGLPYPVAVWAGLEDEWKNSSEIHVDNPKSLDEFRAGKRTSLASMNDNGATFDEIADTIEEKL